MKIVKLVFFLSLIVRNSCINTAIDVTAGQGSEIIIFIHGSMQPPEWRFSDVLRVIQDKIENSIYLKAAEYLRKDPFFTLGQAMQEEGLQPIDLSNKTNASSIVARMCEVQYQWQEAKKLRFYYTFGWNGVVHLYTRYEEAKNLLQQLCEELKKFHEKGLYPKIKIVTYSHGGNVALNLAAVKDDNPEFLHEPIEIDQLIMFATPIQLATDYLVAHPIFKKVYHFYSFNDGIQTMDFTAPKQFFSKRTFKKRKKFKLPDSLVQIRMRTTKSLHAKYKHPHVEKLDYTFLYDKRFRHIYHDPKHTEFWNFQWGSSTYRDIFTLSPLPVVVFYPTIIATLEQKVSTWHEIIFDFAPFYEGAVIKNKKTKKTIVVKMLTKDQLDIIFDLAKAAGRKSIDVHEQKEHLRAAMQKAQDEYHEDHPDYVSKKHKIMKLSQLMR